MKMLQDMVNDTHELPIQLELFKIYVAQERNQPLLVNGFPLDLRYILNIVEKATNLTLAVTEGKS
jgi:hypothetical protein